MRCLVTGGAGFIGSHIQDKLIELGHKVAIVDNLRSGKKAYINSASYFYKLDIRSADKNPFSLQKVQTRCGFSLSRPK